MRTRWAIALTALAAATLVAGTGAAQEATNITTVHLADGSTVPLTDWSLGYDYVARDKATPQYLAHPQVRKARELWNEKKIYPVEEQVLELVYAKAKAGRAPDVERIRLGPPGGKAESIRPKAPDRSLLVPDADKDHVVLARSLDLSGITLTGTRRLFCLVTYSTLVECGAKPEDRVVKVEFH